MNIKNETDVSLFNIDKKYIEVRPSILDRKEVHYGSH